jgi:hypothetical protein
MKVAPDRSCDRTESSCPMPSHPVSGEPPQSEASLATTDAAGRAFEVLQVGATTLATINRRAA